MSADRLINEDINQPGKNAMAQREDILLRL
jgi:hypothetical protein